MHRDSFRPQIYREENLHSYIDMFGDSTVISAIMSLTEEKQADVIKSMCDSALGIGDQVCGNPCLAPALNFVS